MSGFPEVKRFDHPALEEAMLAWWKAHDVFARSVAERAGAPSFTFYEGPPTANGRPGIHHVMARTIKDTFCRYQTMKGHQVERKGGWDTHGLPVEIEVEKELGLKGRQQVEDYGVARYNAACRKSVMRYKEQWDALTERMGYWVDLQHPYITFDSRYIESVWWLLKQIYDKGLLYKGYKIQWYSPGSGTVLSSHEVSLGYTEVQDPSVYVRFRVEGEDETYFLAWTTTPWTLLSNTALAVGPDIPYVKVRHADGYHLILAERRLEVLRAEYDVVARFPGRDLVGKRYTPLFDHFAREVGRDAAWRVIAASFITDDDGTGVAHEAPAFGADDYQAVVVQEGMPLFNPILPDGTFSDRIDLVAGLEFKQADRPIIRNLKERGLLYREESYIHNYPLDWRKGTPLMQYPVESWFIRTTALRDRLVELNRTINWQPEGIGTGRFGQWLENNVDWALSRKRYWGTPLPIWVNDQHPDEVEVIGSIAELRAKCGDQLPDRDEDLDLHRPFVDELTWPAPDGGTMRRVPDLIDVWFDSGAMPFAQWHYPFEHREVFARNFPADFIAEGVDQTRGWFYTLHAIATLVMDSVAFRNVVVNGLVLDGEGNKMSKSKGNTVNPFEVIDRNGADLVRWYLMSNTPPWENLRFSERSMHEGTRRFFGTLENCYAFFATYANVDGFRYAEAPVPLARRTEMDRWILSRLATTIAETDQAYAGYNPTRATRAVERFVEELSNWYIRRSRRRFWSAKEGGSADAEDKQAAYQTVYECLVAVAKLMAPIAPFFSDWLYQALNGVSGHEPHDTVHLAFFPQVETAAQDADLEHRMGLARTISSIVLALRNQCGLNVRQPLAKALVVTGTGVDQASVERVAAIICDEVNVKALDFVSGASGLVRRSARPNFRTLGKRLGARMKAAAEAVKALDQTALEQYVQTGTLTLLVAGEPVELGGDDLEITSEGIAGWLVGQEEGVTVALDTTLTEALRAEGLARETVNRIQNLRKQADFDVTDRIAVRFHATPRLHAAIAQHAPWIRNETLALALEEAASPEGDLVESFDLDEERLLVGVRRLTPPV
jgi:isoleucyl-tRNA synthetase